MRIFGKSCKIAAVFIHWPLAAGGSASSSPYCYSRLLIWFVECVFSIKLYIIISKNNWSN